jgi:DUF1009 family protein
VAPELVAGHGPLGRIMPEPRDAAAYTLGFEIIRALGAHDVGQSVVVTGGSPEAIEGAEGTDAMLERVRLARRGTRRGGVLVKRAKPGQELRVDMPAIGPATVERAVAAGLRGIAVQTGRVLTAERGELIARADAASMFLVGVEDEGGDTAPRASQGTAAARPLARLGSIAPAARDVADVEKGAALLDTLAPYSLCRAVVVARRHVLAVEAGEGIGALLERVSRLRQWGDTARRRRVGVAVLTRAGDLDVGTIEAAATGGLAGLAVMENEETGMKDLAAAAEAANLFLVLCGRAQGKAS